MTRDPFRALEDAVSLWLPDDPVLRAGGQRRPFGAPLLAKLNEQAAGRIDLMAGCGVKKANIAQIAAQTGITTFHTTGRKGSVDSGMRYRKEGVSMGLPSLSEYELWLTDEAEFRACAETVHAPRNAGERRHEKPGKRNLSGSSPRRGSGSSWTYCRPCRTRRRG